MSTTAALEELIGALPGGGEVRPGQLEMAAAVDLTIREGGHLIVQAGTGTGKSLAYLVPAVLSGKKVVVATATKALQDQLAGHDLPFIEKHLGQAFSWAVLKGRSNYLCHQRLAEIRSSTETRLQLGSMAEQVAPDELARLNGWAARTASGDRADLDWEPSPAAWTAVSVGARECPGAGSCPRAAVCFAEQARARAAAADLVVVNLHLYGLDVAAGRAILPEHEVVIIDEAHQLEDVISSTSGSEIRAGRFRGAARAVASVIQDAELESSLESLCDAWSTALRPLVGNRLLSLPQEMARVAALATSRLQRATDALRSVDPAAGSDADARRLRALRQVGGLVGDLSLLLDTPADHVAWVEGPGHSAAWRLAPTDVSSLLAARLWPEVSAVLTSATVPPGLAARVGLPAVTRSVDVGSPFDYQANALLYCAAHLPDPRTAGFDAAAHDEMEALIGAAGGRTLALFTSWRAMEAALDELRTRLPFQLLGQRDLPKPALMSTFGDDETSCLFATLSFWQGIDVPGPSLSLVTIDRLPFPRPDEPLLQARRESAGTAAFQTIDLPRATTLLAQGVGRLIRTSSDRGVVAVLDPRLATKASYRWEIIRALPPMRRTRERAEAEAFLQQISTAAPTLMTEGTNGQ